MATGTLVSPPRSLSSGPRALIAALLPFCVIACGGGTTTLTGPSADKCQISVTAFTRTFAAPGGAGTVTLTASRECSWTASSPTPWISFPSRPAGQGDGSFSFGVGSNPAARPREGAIEVSGQRLAIAQGAAPCRFELEPETTHVAASAASAAVRVATTDGCGWTSESLVPWVRVTAGERGEGAGTVSFRVEANTGGERSGALRIATLTHQVVQAAAAAPSPQPPPAPEPPPPSPPPPSPPPPSPPPPSPEPPPPPPPEPPPPQPPPACSYQVSPRSATVPADGGTARVQIETGAECAWVVTTSAAWLTASPAEGRGSAAVTLAAVSNPDPAPRSASAIVAGETVDVTQAGAEPPAQVRVAGKIQNLSGSCPTVHFKVRGDEVATAPTTLYGPDPPGTACGDLRNGRDVVVTGVRGGGVISATLIVFETNGSNP